MQPYIGIFYPCSDASEACSDVSEPCSVAIEGRIASSEAHCTTLGPRAILAETARLPPDPSPAPRWRERVASGGSNKWPLSGRGQTARR